MSWSGWYLRNSSISANLRSVIGVVTPFRWLVVLLLEGNAPVTFSVNHRPDSTGFYTLPGTLTDPNRDWSRSPDNPSKGWRKGQAEIRRRSACEPARRVGAETISQPGKKPCPPRCGPSHGRAVAAKERRGPIGHTALASCAA